MQPGTDSGCTAVLALLHGRELIVANAGDSRCIMCRRGKAIDLSIDHKPEDDLERKRIEKAGGQVTADGRVNGGLNLSRAVGKYGLTISIGFYLHRGLMSSTYMCVQKNFSKLSISRNG